MSQQNHFETDSQPLDTDEAMVNISSSLDVAALYSMSLLADGQMLCLQNQEKRYVFILNDLCPETEKMRQNDFVLTTVCMAGTSPSISCTCYTYKLNNTLYPAGDCIHCQFVLERICPYLLKGVPSPPVTQFEQMLHNALRVQGSDIIELSSTAHVRKFVVKGADDDKSVMFVHLAHKYAYVKCMSGICNIQMGCRRSVKSLDLHPSLCPHLQVFKRHRDMWDQYVDLDVPADPLPAENVMFPDPMIDLGKDKVCLFSIFLTLKIHCQ